MLAFAAVTLASSVASDTQWLSFKQRFNKTYATEVEEAGRRATFEAELHRLAAVNTTTQGVTQFSDLTADEFSQRWLGHRPSTTPGGGRRWDGTCHSCARSSSYMN